MRAEPEMVKRIGGGTGTVRHHATGWTGSTAKVTVELGGVDRLRRGRREVRGGTRVGAIDDAQCETPPQPGGSVDRAHEAAGAETGGLPCPAGGEDAAGKTARIDERDYWFDGKTFEEL